jgi:hypothetical protein
VLYPTNNLTGGLAGEFMYGEPTFGAMARICHLVSSELISQKKPLQSRDIFLDWGCGAGKWLFFARELFEVPDMIALGIEGEQRIFDICYQNLLTARHKGFGWTNILHAQSQSFATFCPARVMFNYDGGTQKLQNTKKSRIHLAIMRTAFCSPSVDVIVSSRLNFVAFNRYFSPHIHKLCGSLWKCIYVPKCDFGGSKFNVNVWFRLSPMRNCNSNIDDRMRELLSGLFVLSLRKIYLC